jgi:hypothetical protein
MNYGDIVLDATVDFLFTTAVGGVPTTLDGTPSLAVYEAGSAVEITAGVTLTVDYDSKTGLNRCQVAATDVNGFAAAKNYSIAVAAGTLDGVSIANTILATFSIANRVAQSPIDNADALLDYPDGIEVGLTPRESHRLEAAAAAGVLSGAATPTVVIQNAVAGDKNRITATVDADGNRTAVAIDVS